MQDTQETQVQSLGREDPLEKEMTTHSSTLAWRIPWTEEPGSPSGHKESDTTECTHRHTWNPQDPGLGHWHLTGDSDAHQSLHRAVISKVGNQGNLDLRRELYRYLAYGLTAALVPSFKMNR